MASAGGSTAAAIPKPTTWAGHRRVAWEGSLATLAPALEALDLYCAIKNEIQKGLKVQVSKPTPLGGGVSVTFVGVLLAVCVMLVEQFAVANSAAVTGSIKLTAWEIDTLARYPPHARSFEDLAAPAAPLVPGPGRASGLQVTIRTHGARCAAPLRWSGLMAVSNWTTRAPVANATAAATTHVFDCEQCVADALSSLTVTFDPSCASFDITAAAVGAFALAAYQGHQESDTLNKKLALLGPTAALSAGQVEALSRKLATSANISASSARQITTELVAAGKLSAPALEAAPPNPMALPPVDSIPAADGTAAAGGGAVGAGMG